MKRFPKFSTTITWLISALAVTMAIGIGLGISLIQTKRQPTGEYVIGTNHSPPFQIVSDDGSVGGPVVELMNLAAENLGITLKWQVVPHGPDRYLIDEASGIDLWPLVMQLPERATRFHISEPYAGSQYVLFSKREFPGHFSNIPTDITIGHTAFKHIELYFQEHFPHQKSFQSEFAESLMADVCEDRIEAAVVETNAVDNFLQGLPTNCGDQRVHLKILPDWRINLGIGARFGRADVANALRTEVGKMARSGALEPLYDRYFALERTRHRNLFLATRQEQHSEELRALILACVVVVVMLDRKSVV